MERKHTPGSDSPTHATERRPWKAPRLTEYGPVSKLTQAGPGSAIEGSTANRQPMVAMCL